MTYRAADMVRDVRVAIDMNRGDAPLEFQGDCDTLSLDEIIRSKLADAVRLVETEAPALLLESGHDFGDSPVFWEESESAGRGRAAQPSGKGFVVLPDDFMRLIAFRMSDWRRTLYEAITESDPEYAKQSSRFKGICGCPEKPVCAVVRRSEGKVLEFYSSRDTTARVTQATYLPMPRIDRDGGIDVADGCYRAAVYRAASLALASVGDPLSSTMLELSRGLLNA